jgi:two-component system, chemotaxis family, response regulator Rcp1
MVPLLAQDWPIAQTGECRMPHRATRLPVNILLVEDSRNDAELMLEALGESDLTLNITVVEDGEQAVDYLRRRGAYRAAPRPDLILLDLHLPRKNGHEVLADIKQDESLRLIPVVLLTSSDSEEAFREAYDRHVNCCVRKPSDLDQFTLAVKRIESFWLQLARLVRES